MTVAYSIGSEAIEQSSPVAILQAGAVCLRMGERANEGEIALVASRANGSWGIPKGHVELGETSRQAAEREAYEEAGVEGIALEPVIGRFFYRKEDRSLLYSVSVHLVNVRGIALSYPEKGERRIKWVPLIAAAREVANPKLRRIIVSLISNPLYEHHTGDEL
ncbi:ADP-ribose pyrophosphatase YjhB (NUDIX family) [Rhizobium sp. ERR 1071]|uniref:NUDIX hydrolase n=1 Tax=Rhizobium sp. ERR 1071 TaxID=2572677 RepID=UPI00119AC439|nr:NUDIX domain-containing protein [Rhizobium sp. ERR1071]TWB07796.1 ADP-ribose pyrophosphatase YjhB (NUDIX family) [Rhizobium sp. ERR1071]